MRSKAPLVLMEQIVMVLVFALTAALCLRMFVLSGQLSRKYAATDRAVTEAQNAAEWLKQGRFEEYLEKRENLKRVKAPLSVGFPWLKYWSGLSVSSPEDHPDPGVEPMSPALQVDSLPVSYHENTDLL